METHVISSIVHIIHDYDDESKPWPLHLEDHHGQMHEVNLEEGQVRTLVLTCMIYFTKIILYWTQSYEFDYK